MAHFPMRPKTKVASNASCASRGSVFIGRELTYLDSFNLEAVGGSTSARIAACIA
jgi:hypothetical protein